MAKKDISSALVHEHRLILRMLDLLEKRAALTRSGEYSNYRFYLDGVDFIRNYADRFHHAKEEDILFEALINNGMPRANSPVAAMLMEHDHGRAFVKAMEEAAGAALVGEPDANRLIAENALGYVGLLREHIAKEDDILYPLAERVLPVAMRDEIIAGYAAAEARTPDDFEKNYAEIVARYEAEPLKNAA
jgi:hemerythrin-like domain-containing protein